MKKRLLALLAIFACLALLTQCKNTLLDSVKKVNEQYVATLSAPVAPGTPTLTAADGQLTVNWTAVLGATSYEVYWNGSADPATASGPQTATGTSSVIAGLSNGNTYYAWVKAVNKIGKSALGLPGTGVPVSATGEPSAPATPSLVAGNGQLTASWAAVSGATGYDVYWSSSNDSGTIPPANTKGSTELSATITGLANGTTSFVWIKAKNAFGSSGFSMSANGVPIPPPEAPAVPTIHAGNGYFVVSWTAVNGASGYAVAWSGTNDQATITVSNMKSTTEANCQVTGLVNGGTYYVWVRASNSAGTSGYSSYASGIPVLPPAAPGTPTLTGADGQVSVSWPPVSGAAGYDVYWHTENNSVKIPAANTKPSSDTAYVITGLANGTAYYVWVTARNGVGDSSGFSPSASATPIAASTPPATPAAPTVVGGDGNITVSWTALSGATSYAVYWSKVNDTSILVSGGKQEGITKLYAAISPLANSQFYYVWIKASNAIGSSAYGPPSGAETIATPGQPTLTMGDRQFDVLWPGIANATNYDIFWSTNNDSSTIPDSNLLTSTNLSGLHETVSGLASGTTYYVWVKAKIQNSASKYSPPASGTTKFDPTLGGFPSIASNFGDAPFALAAPTSDSAGAFTYTSSDSSVATVSSSTVTLGAVGTTTITANQAAAETFAKGSITAQLTVSPILPTVTTATASYTAAATASGGGNVTANGGAAISARGVCWSATSDSPTTADSKTSDATGTGSYSSVLTGLQAGILYHVRAYATNAAGTAYGPAVSYLLPTVSFDLNDALATGSMAPQAIPAGTQANLTANAFAKPGWTFSGWATSSSGTASYGNGAGYAIGNANATLFAKWTANPYTITFLKNDGAATGTMGTQTISCGSSANLSANAFVKTGWYFAGWARTSGGVVEYADGASYTMGSANVSLYATWSIHQYTVSYNGNNYDGGTVPGPSNYDYNASVTVAANSGNLTRTGYTFDGWNTQADGNGTNYVAGTGSFTMGAASLVLYAKWSPVTYTITYVLNSGTNNAGNPASYNITTATINLLSPTRTSYTFGAWYTEASFTTQVTQVALGSTGNKTFYAKFTGSVSFNGNGATGGSTGAQTITAGATAALVANGFTRTGFSFSSWNSASNGSGTSYANLASYTMNGNATLYAQWKGMVTFNGNGATAGSTGPQTIAENATAALLSNGFTRTGYNFASWNTLSNGTGTIYANLANYTMTGGNATLYAQWTPVTYTITYVLNGGSNNAGNPATYNITTPTITLLPPTRSNFTFNGWYTEPTFTNLASPITQGSTGDKTFYAMFLGTITFNGNGSGGGFTDSVPVLAEQTASLPINGFSRANFSFTEWNTAPDGSGTSYLYYYTMTAGNITLYAQWSGTITFNGNGANGGSTSPQTIVANHTTPLLGNNFWRGNFNFTGWNTNSNGSGTSYSNYASYTMTAGNVTLYAQWSGTITFNGNGATGGSTGPQEIAAGANVSLVANGFTRTGCTFASWNTAANGSGTSYVNLASYWMNNGNATLYAQWTPIPYNITYFLDDGSDPGNPTTYNVTTPTITLLNPTKTGYTFTGWSPSSTIPLGSTGDKSFIASWSITWYTVYYDGNGATWGSPPMPRPYAYGATVTVSASNLIKINDGGISYRFNCWNTQANGFGISYFPGGTFTLGASDCALYAKWSPIAVGDMGPGGGYIFYDKTFYSGDPSWRYLEAAPSDPWESLTFAWYPGALFATSCTATAIGTGKANTDSIVLQQGPVLTYAARSAQEANINGLTGWFLPSKDELNLMYMNLHPLGEFNSGVYWTSSEASIDWAWTQAWYGEQFTDGKGWERTIRPARQF